MPGWIPLAFLGMLHLDGAKAEHLPWLIVRYKIWSSIVLVYAPWAGPLGGCIPRQIARNYSNLIAGICQKKSTCQADDTCTGNSNSSFAVNRCLIHVSFASMRWFQVCGVGEMTLQGGVRRTDIPGL